MKRIFLALLLALTTSTFLFAQTDTTVKKLPLIFDNPEHEARIAWWREAKFGMFIHWGLYAVPAGEWNGKKIPLNVEWIQSKAGIPVKEYEKFTSQFNPVKFNAEEWAQLAEDAGMKYIVYVSKHHDGFAMFKSEADSYNIFDATPFKRDPLQELAIACKKHNLRLCVYYSHNLDWHDPNARGNTRDFGPEDKKDVDKYVHEKGLPQIKELLTKYGTIHLVWFDMAGGLTMERAQEFADMVHTLQPNCLINSRLSKQGVQCDYRTMGDNSIPTNKVSIDWETAATLNNTWGYSKSDTVWKSDNQLVFNLIDIVSKGGNYLLNVGPTAEGIILPENQRSLRTIGQWLKVNGESIYGAGATPFGAELHANDSIRDEVTGKNSIRILRDWRCTTKPGKLYFHLIQWPGNKFVLPVIKEKVVRIYFLTGKKAKNLKFKVVNGQVEVSIPQKALNPLASVLCVEIKS